MNASRVGQVWRNKLEWETYTLLVVGVVADDLDGVDNVLALDLSVGTLEVHIFDGIEDDPNWERVL